jgi:hypothetical protein
MIQDNMTQDNMTQDNMTQDNMTQDNMTQDNMILMDELNGGEYKIENGREQVSLWLPISREEKAKLIENMTAKNTSMTELVMTAIQDFV